MKDLPETISWILFVSFMLAMYFLFSGEPSVWDLWQQVARGVCK